MEEKLLGAKFVKLAKIPHCNGRDWKHKTVCQICEKTGHAANICFQYLNAVKAKQDRQLY